MAEKILVVDDEKPIADILQFTLEKEGYEVVCAYDGDEALEKVNQEKPDLILLDIMLPKKDGNEVCRLIRQHYQMPIIMLTARDSEVDKVLGLELGADDYVTKPYSSRELLARVKANLRRHKNDHDQENGNHNKIFVHEIEIDLNSYTVKKSGKAIDLTYPGV